MLYFNSHLIKLTINKLRYDLGSVLAANIILLNDLLYAAFEQSL